jgi:endonuclease/exonuclease/phosphatase family metal-dependent hydrolase
MKVNELKKHSDRRLRQWGFLTVLFLEMLMAVSVPVPASAQVLSEGKGNLRVMTYNVYEGADLKVAFSAKTQQEFVAAVSAILANVQATNPPARAVAIARQIGKANPTLVSLQEVTEWKTCPANATMTGCASAPVVLYDLLNLVKDALQTQSLPYKEVGRVITNEFNAPAITNTGSVIVFYTQRSAILARADIDPTELRLCNVQSAKYDAKLTIPTVVGNFVVQRAWISVDAKFHDKDFRLIDTQLEAFDPATNYSQGQELISGPAETSKPVVIAMDSNSRANPPADPFTPTYTNFLVNGFKDAWTETQGDAPGATGVQDPSLMNPVSQVTQRIDLILLHGNLDAKAVELFGGQQADKTNGLWPSDHLGVAARLGTE